MFPATTLIRAISLLVPSSRRQDWIAEWRAEIEHAWVAARREGQGRGQLRARLGLRALDSLPDALCLRRRDGGSGWLWTLRDALRSLRRRPGFALAVILTLALGVGSATAIYTILDGLMLRPVPFRDPEQLVSVTGRNGNPMVDPEETAVWREQGDVFQAAHAHYGRTVILTGAGEARSLRAEAVDPGFLSMLGVRPLLGRDFDPVEALPGNDRVVLLGHAIWREAFAGDRSIVGRSVELDGLPHTVVGVLPPTVRVVTDGGVHLMVPLSGPPERGGLYLTGRLRSGLSLDAARARLADVSEVFARERPHERGWAVGLMAIEQSVRDEIARGFWTLAGAVLCLLLIACANAAGLLFLRGISRQPELSLRVALGSSRASLVRHAFAESMLLALAAGALGTLVAWVSVRALVALMPSALTTFSYNTVGLDGRVLAFALLLTLATGLAFGVAPALRAAATVAARAGRSVTASRRDVRLRSLIQVGQFALAVLLLSGVALFGRSFHRLLSVPLGYDVDRVLELQLVSLERLRGDPEGTATFARELDERLAELPGVVGVSRRGGLGIGFGWTFELDDGRRFELGDAILPHANVDTAFFRVMGIAIAEGRGFQSEDALPESPGVIVDPDFAAAAWPGESAVGRSFRQGTGPRQTVVGVAADTKLFGPQERYGPFQLYYAAAGGALRSGVVTIHTERDPAALIPLVRALVQELDPAQPIATLRTGREALGESVANPRFLFVIMGVFAAVAVTLAAIGVYGLAAFTVAQRTREIGVRMALGARARRVVGEVVGWGFLLGGVGVILGLAAATLLSRFVSALLFGVSPLDPVALGTAASVLLAACGAALLAPARRAASVDPAEALRSE